MGPSAPWAGRSWMGRARADYREGGMADDEFHYDRMVQEALRSVVGKALTQVVERGCHPELLPLEAVWLLAGYAHTPRYRPKIKAQ